MTTFATYTTVTLPSGLRRVVRSDGSSLRPAAPQETPAPPPDAAALLAEWRTYERGHRTAAVGLPVGAERTRRAERAARTALARAQLQGVLAALPGPQELRRRREALGLSQRDLAAAAGASRGALAAVESTGLAGRTLAGTRLKVARTLARLEGNTVQQTEGGGR